MGAFHLWFRQGAKKIPNTLIPVLMKKNYGFFTLFAAASLALASCEKQTFDRDSLTNKPSQDKQIDPSLIHRSPSTPQEMKLVENLDKVTTVFKELYRDKANLKVVNASILSHTYTDESILLRDLIYPEGSLLANNPRFKAIAAKHSVNLTAFASDFWTIANKVEDFEFANFLSSLKSSNLGNATKNRNAAALLTDGDQVSLYFPYSQSYMIDVPYGDGSVSGPVTTLVTATADADAGYGSQSYIDASGVTQYKTVIVDDEYSYNNPTHIVGLNGIEPYGEPKADIMARFPPTGPIPTPGVTREIKQVYVGDVRCRHQYDALISFTGNGGGSEIRFTRADGFLKIVDGQVQADVWSSGDMSISRWHIRNHKFVDYSSEWDGDWEAANLNENFAIYEEDNRNAVEISGSLVTTLTASPGNTVVGTIGFKATFKSDDALIRQLNYTRASFFPLNRIDLEGEMLHGWPVRDRNARVSYTLQDRTFIP